VPRGNTAEPEGDGEFRKSDPVGLSYISWFIKFLQIVRQDPDENSILLTMQAARWGKPHDLRGTDVLR
jgi:hypothetical protein